jgi:hypothetical protein
MEWHHWIALALLAAAAWSVQIRLKQGREARAVAGWTVTKGQVLSHGIAEETSRDADGDSSTVYSPELSYAYAVGGGEHQGTRLALDGVSFSSRAKAQAYLDARPVGSEIPVYVNPNDASDALLSVERKNDWWVPALFVALAALVALGVFGQ